MLTTMPLRCPLSRTAACCMRISGEVTLTRAFYVQELPGIDHEDATAEIRR